MAGRDRFDVVILGVGPAGLQAAVHAGRRKATVMLLGSVRKSSLFTAHIETNKQQETNIAGIYAAGEICGMPWQMAKAVGEGCVAGMEAAACAKKPKGRCQDMAAQ